MVLFILLLLSNRAQACTTWRGGACILPFLHEARLYTECTERLWPDEKGEDRIIPMCPTKVDRRGEAEVWGRCSSDCHLQGYKSNDQAYDEILTLASVHPSIARPFSIGVSELGTQLIGIRISRGIRNPRANLKPMVRLVGNIHGNEAVGREVLLAFARHLLLGYGKDDRLTRLVNSTDISLLPSLNPDGFSRAVEGKCSGTGKEAGSYGEGGKDLDQDFPTAEQYSRFQEELDYDPFLDRQPETKAVMQWSVEHPFVLGASLHSGAVLVSYPWDRPSSGSSGEHLTADQELFHHLAEGYVRSHPGMTNSTCFRSVAGGLVNGAAWNTANRRQGEKSGSMRDFAYLFTNSLELSIELTCCKYPRPYFLLREWEQNRESLLGVLEQVHMGVKGVVFNELGRPQGNCDIISWKPDGERWGRNVTTGGEGEYWRLLLPNDAGQNTFTLQAWYSDCEPGGSGRVFASLRHRIIVSRRNPLKEQHMYLTQVGYCGIDSQPERAQDRTALVEGILRQTRVSQQPARKAAQTVDDGDRFRKLEGLITRQPERPRSRVDKEEEEEDDSSIEKIIGNFFQEKDYQADEEQGDQKEQEDISFSAILSVFE